MELLLQRLNIVERQFFCENFDKDTKISQVFQKTSYCVVNIYLLY